MTAARLRPARIAVLLAGLLPAALGGCSAPASRLSALRSPPPYRIIEVDKAMSCEALAASFHFAAVRAARLEYWLAVGQLPTYGLDRFGVDAPAELEDERGRLDALTDLARTKGCPVQDPVGAVALERERLSRPAGLPVLSRRG